MILNQVQMLDQEVAPPRAVAQKRAKVSKCGRLDLPALRGPPRAPPAAVLAGC
jgi:hypothetical protein